VTIHLDDDEWLRLIRAIRDGDTLPKQTRKWLADLLDLIRRGEDPRDRAGTKTQPGRPTNPRAIVGMHYWGLRAKYGRGGAAAACKEAAWAWKLSESRVKAIGKNTRFAFKESMSRVENLATVLEAIESETQRPNLRLIVNSQNIQSPN
jgi:hypothetical protein